MSCRRSFLWAVVMFSLHHACGWNTSDIVITAEEFRFSPARIEWPSNLPLRLLIRNHGRERHAFHSPDLFGAKAAVTWHRPIVMLQEAHTIVLEPGQSIELHFTLSPGLYPFRCWIKGHTGMEGAIIVEEHFPR